jgi:hypothetical protein
LVETPGQSCQQRVDGLQQLPPEKHQQSQQHTEAHTQAKHQANHRQRKDLRLAQQQQRQAHQQIHQQNRADPQQAAEQQFPAIAGTEQDRTFAHSASAPAAAGFADAMRRA